MRDEVQALSPTVLDEIEADSYGCMSTYIDSIQDSYTAEQPGIQRMLFRLQEIVQKIDCTSPLAVTLLLSITPLML